MIEEFPLLEFTEEGEFYVLIVSDGGTRSGVSIRKDCTPREIAAALRGFSFAIEKDFNK